MEGSASPKNARGAAQPASRQAGAADLSS